MKLSDYFKYPNYAYALDRYAQFAYVRRWDIRGKLMLYADAKTAFDSDRPDSEKLQAFDRIYGTLRSRWQVFRNSRGPALGSQQTFHSLCKSLAHCSRTSGLTLDSIQLTRDARDVLSTGLVELTTIKTVRDYPHMAVSKFAHFYNPQLFPIFDNEVIWKQVCCGAFSEDYDVACKKAGIPRRDVTSEFYICYTLWASAMIADADPDMMMWFQDWLSSQIPGAGIVHRIPRDEFYLYFSTAFEYIAIGAAMIELEGNGVTAIQGLLHTSYSVA